MRNHFMINKSFEEDTYIDNAKEIATGKQTLMVRFAVIESIR